MVLSGCGDLQIYAQKVSNGFLLAYGEIVERSYTMLVKIGLVKAFRGISSILMRALFVSMICDIAHFYKVPCI